MSVCRNPLCDKQLRSDNTTGFCRTCVQQYPGRRWYLLSRKDWRKVHRERLEYMRNYRLADRAARQAAGICRFCPLPAGGKIRCRGCMDKVMEWQRRHRAWKRSLRECA